MYALLNDHKKHMA